MIKRLGKVFLYALYLLVLIEMFFSVGGFVLKQKIQAERDEDVHGARTILCLGDSCTYGVGASSQRGSYPAQLQYLLDKKYPGEFRVVSRGLPGVSSRLCVEAFKAYFEDDRPVAVVWCAGANDIWNYSMYSEEVKHLLSKRAYFLFKCKQLFYELKSVQFCRVLFFRYLFADIEKIGSDESVNRISFYTKLTSEDVEASTKLSDKEVYMALSTSHFFTLSAYREIISLCSKYNIALIFKDYLFGSLSDLNAVKEATAGRELIRFNSVLNELQKRGIEVFSYDGFHPNDLGYYNVAVAVYNRLIDDGVLAAKAERIELPVFELPVQVRDFIKGEEKQ